MTRLVLFALFITTLLLFEHQRGKTDCSLADSFQATKAGVCEMKLSK